MLVDGRQLIDEGGLIDRSPVDWDRLIDEGGLIACPQDAKQCPDGSYVSRQPPGCQFAPCPLIPIEGEPLDGPKTGPWIGGQTPPLAME